MDTAQVIRENSASRSTGIAPGKPSASPSAASMALRSASRPASVSAPQ